MLNKIGLPIIVFTTILAIFFGMFYKTVEKFCIKVCCKDKRFNKLEGKMEPENDRCSHPEVFLVKDVPENMQQI